MSPALRAVTLACAVGSGAVGGVFFAFSTFIMKGLDQLPPAHGAAAMQQINKYAPTPWFMIPLFGTAALGVGFAIRAIGHLDEPGARYQLAGGALYLVAIVLTVAYHVPKNDALAALDPSAPPTAAFWKDYVTSWTALNHVRTITCLGAAIAWTLALRA